MIRGEGGEGGGVRRDKEEVERLSAGTVAGSCFVANFLSGMALSQSNLLVQSSGRLQGGGGWGCLFSLPYSSTCPPAQLKKLHPVSSTLAAAHNADVTQTKMKQL